MIVNHLRAQLSPACARGLVFAAGGSADIILAKVIAAELARNGCTRVDLAQPLNCRKLTEKVSLAEPGKGYALEVEDGLDPEAVLRHHACVPVAQHTAAQRGKGLNISSSLEWTSGSRYVCAAFGDGLASLARRRSGDRCHYDFAIAVDGGGDVLTHGEDEFDRVVIAGFKSGCPSTCPLLLVSLGLGADGGSAPEDFERCTLQGWRSVAETEVDQALANSMHRELDRLGLWHPSPAKWSHDDPDWSYGFKVLQIVVLAVRNEFPFPMAGDPADLTRFPRRGALKLMNKRLLREARIFRSETTR